jgi:hypothetical protein
MKINILSTHDRDREYCKHVEIDGHTLDISVRYSLGGMNWASSRVEPRGFYLSVTPVERSTSPGGVQWSSFTAFSGIKVLLQSCEKYQKLKLDRIAYSIFHDLEENPKVWEVYDMVAKRNNWEPVCLAQT